MNSRNLYWNLERALFLRTKSWFGKKEMSFFRLRKKHVNYLFEASVGRGVPIKRPIYSCLAANKIECICGVLSAATNFIITKMFEDGFSFEKVLLLAKEKGCAEKDQTDDINRADSS